MFDTEDAKHDEALEAQISSEENIDDGNVEGEAEDAVIDNTDNEASDALKKRWYVVQAYSGYEVRVQKTLLERIKLQGLEDCFGDILVPTEEIVEMKAGQKRRSERKFFPGYVLVKMAMTDEAWHLVCKTPRVNGFIGGTSQKPAPISDQEANNILEQIEQGVDKPRPKVIFEPGEVVRVTDGPFADFNGVVEEVNYEKSRLHVAVLIFGRSTPVELEFGQVEKG